ncbi:hypothetical protein CRYUN_Cryun25bG0017000 [Craigia yunnanensis]
MLSLLNHSNHVNLVGYCAEKNQRILVYEYMANGSLDDHLLDLPPDKKPSDWNTRIKIALDAAKGLEYLYETADPPVIYSDFKASNILLDQDFNPKLSDFGLAKLGPTGDKSHLWSCVFGVNHRKKSNRQFKTNRRTESCHFGNTLIQRMNFTLMADPLLDGNYPIKNLHQVLAVAAMCLQEEANARPLMIDVVTALEYLTTSNEPEVREE